MLNFALWEIRKSQDFGMKIDRDLNPGFGVVQKKRYNVDFMVNLWIIYG